MIKHMPVLTMIFMTLKLCNVIAWSWFDVLIPMIIFLVYHIFVFFVIIKSLDMEEAIRIIVDRVIDGYGND